MSRRDKEGVSHSLKYEKNAKVCQRGNYAKMRLSGGADARSKSSLTKSPTETNAKVTPVTSETSKPDAEVREEIPTTLEDSGSNEAVPGDKKVNEMIDYVIHNLQEAEKALASLGENFEHELKLMLVEVMKKFQNWVSLAQVRLDGAKNDLGELRRELASKMNDLATRDEEISELKTKLNETEAVKVALEEDIRKSKESIQTSPTRVSRASRQDSSAPSTSQQRAGSVQGPPGTVDEKSEEFVEKSGIPSGTQDRISSDRNGAQPQADRALSTEAQRGVSQVQFQDPQAARRTSRGQSGIPQDQIGTSPEDGTGAGTASLRQSGAVPRGQLGTPSQGQFRASSQGEFGGAQGQNEAAQGQFGGTQGQNGTAQGQFGGTQGQIGAAQGQFGAAQGQFRSPSRAEFRPSGGQLDPNQAGGQYGVPSGRGSDQRTFGASGVDRRSQEGLAYDASGQMLRPPGLERFSDSDRRSKNDVAVQSGKSRDKSRRSTDLELELCRLKKENERIMKEKTDYENAIQRALLRGVSSLNAETLKVLKSPPTACYTPCPPPTPVNCAESNAPCIQNKTRDNWTPRGCRLPSNVTTTSATQWGEGSVRVARNVPARPEQEQIRCCGTKMSPCAARSCPKKKSPAISDPSMVFLLHQADTSSLCVSGNGAKVRTGARAKTKKLDNTVCVKKL